MTFDAFGIKRNRTFARADACRVELACRSTRICLLAQKEESARKSPLYFVTIATAVRPGEHHDGLAHQTGNGPTMIELIGSAHAGEEGIGGHRRFTLTQARGRKAGRGTGKHSQP